MNRQSTILKTIIAQGWNAEQGMKKIRLKNGKSSRRLELVFG
jgi:hypothetical protein